MPHASRTSPCTMDGGATGVCENGSCVGCIDDHDCPGGLAGYCYNTQCASCSNGVQDGDETAIDCGNARCGLCNGANCRIGTSKCKSGPCADGVCCVPLQVIGYFIPSSTASHRSLRSSLQEGYLAPHPPNPLLSKLLPAPPSTRYDDGGNEEIVDDEDGRDSDPGNVQ